MRLLMHLCGIKNRVATKTTIFSKNFSLMVFDFVSLKIYKFKKIGDMRL